MFAPKLARLVTLAFLIGPASAIAQQGPRIDVLTGEPVKPRSTHPRPEPEIFNAPHAPPQERRAEDPPIEIYAAPQMDTGTQQNQFSSAPGRGPVRQSDPYASRRLRPRQDPLRYGSYPQER